MNLKDKLILQRITSADVLSEAERAELKADAELQAMLEENRLLAAMAGEGDSKGREAMLRRAYAQASEIEAADKEHSHMNWITRTFAGRSLYQQAAIALGMLLVAAVAVTALVVSKPGTTFASSEGVTLTYTLSAGQSVDSLQDELLDVLRSFREKNGIEKGKLLFGVIERATQDDDGPETIETAVSISIVEGGDDDAQALAEVLESRLGLTAPQIANQVWFSDDGMPSDKGITIALEGHEMTFPIDSTEQEIEDAIRAWLDEKGLGEDYSVDVTLNRNEGPDGEEVEVSVEVKDRNK